MTFATGNNKVIKIGNVPSKGGNNTLEMILRESGRFIIRGVDEFIALSEKKTRAITVGGSIGAGSQAEYFNQYDSSPVGVDTQFETGDMFPQDMLNEYTKVTQVNIYGIALLCDMSLTGEPSDAIARLLGLHGNYWISRQPITSWANEDCVGVSISAYNTIPEKGLSEITEGVTKLTAKKKLIPLFVPIKSSFPVDKTKDKVYLWSDIAILGYCAASTLGGSVAGSCTLDHRFIIGKGFLAEEVEELLSPTQ